MKDDAEVYTADFSSQNLKVFPKVLHKYMNCKSVNLSCNSIESMRTSSFSFCLQLKELKLYANRIQEIDGLQKLHKLEELQLHFNEIKTCGLSLKHNKNLKLLRLDSNKISVIKTEEICSLSNLTYIDVSSNNLTSINCFNVLTNIEEIHCTHNKLEKILNLHSLKKLREFNGSDNVLTDISGLKFLPNLSVLTLDNNKLTNLLSLGPVKSLQDLQLCNNHISDLTHITKQFPVLEVFYISNNRITCIDQIESLTSLFHLKELSLNGNPIFATMETKQDVLSIMNSPPLEILDKVHISKVPFKNRQFGTMRPMSANQLVSTRLIEDQMSYSEMCVDEFKDKLKSQFSVVRTMLTDLPRPQSSTSPTSSVCRIPSSSSSGRPTSRCSNRARLESAKAFAADYF